MDNRTIGIEVEMTGIPRTKALEIASCALRATKVSAKPPNYALQDRMGRKWRVDYDDSILLLRNTESGLIPTSDEAYAIEIVSPVLRAGQASIVGDVISELKNAGAALSETCGLHVHVGGTGHTPESVRRLVVTVHSYQARLFAALNINHKRLPYCGFPDSGLVERLSRLNNPSMGEVEGAWYFGNKAGKRRLGNNIRRQFVNLHSFFNGIGTVEFRGFNATLDPAGIGKCVGMALAIDEAARTGDCQRLDGMLAAVPEEREQNRIVKPKIRFAM